MDLIWEGMGQAVALIVQRDRELLGVTFLSLAVSGSATALSLVLGVSLGTLLALGQFPGRGLVVSV